MTYDNMKTMTNGEQAETKAQHTPGPWKVTTLNGKHTVWGCKRVVCQTQMALPEIDGRLGSPTCPETSEANARLIAAAPELLEVLRLTRLAIENLSANIGYPSVSDDCLRKLCNSANTGIAAAIAKAEGRA